MGHVQTRACDCGWSPMRSDLQLLADVCGQDTKAYYVIMERAGGVSHGFGRTRRFRLVCKLWRQSIKRQVALGSGQNEALSFRTWMVRE